MAVMGRLFGPGADRTRQEWIFGIRSAHRSGGPPTRDAVYPPPVTTSHPTVIDLLRERVMDAELAALAWLLATHGVPVHVAAANGADAARTAAALGALALDAAVTAGTGSALEEVLRQPVPLRPATGAILILDDRRVVAAHLLRPPLRDAGGHVHSQGPAVLATWDPRDDVWEHFAWGVAPDLADATGRPAGDVEIEQARRREYLEALVTAGVTERTAVRTALAGYGVRTRRH